ncbi:MAG: methyl-accepting chemotaxis protein, partial [Pseudomonadales bacterium]|nr:methyl-accepting chemotaxis protein [Pseudomonadales bacterium]
SFLLSMLMRSVVIRPINDVIHALEDIAHGEGDLTVRLQDGVGEIGALSSNFNVFVEKIQGLITQIVGTMNGMSRSVTQMAIIADKTSKGVDHQRSETDQAAVAMNQMSTASQEVSRNALEAADSARHAEESVFAAKGVLSDTVQSVAQLAKEIDLGANVVNALQGDVGNIVTVLDVIRGIAEQTNLLALNAAIEAARAGEQGRGFAVVADEVRTLASRTQESTQEIQDMIERLQSGASEAVKVMEASKESGDLTVGKANDAEGTLDEITSAISTISDMTTQIASAIEEQSAVSEDINRNLTRIQDIAVDTAADTGASTDTSQELLGLCDELRGQVTQFKV